jgi:hypothetical protein
MANWMCSNGDGVLGVFFGNGDGTFQNADRFFPFPLVGQESDSTDVVADFNGDGIPDIASTNAIMLGNGDGTFHPYFYFLTGNVDFVDVTTADFNGDGKPDLAVTTLDFNNRIYAVNVLLGKGDGTFRPAVAYNLSDAGSVIAADLNGDHIPDLVVDNPDGFVEVLLGRGDGTFQSPGEYPTLFSAGTLLVRDFNGDGKPDILATGCSPGCATGAYIFLRGNGDGTFQPGTEVDLPANQLALAAGDFDGDGRLDFAVTLFTNQVTIFLGNGDGTFQQSQSYDLGGGGFPIRVADFNGDGKLDLAITTDQLALLLGNGDGTFQPVQYYVAGCCRSGVGDFNADGKPDLDVAGNILLNIADIPSFTFSIDLTGSGTGAVTVVPGFVCTSSCSHDYAKGANLTLTASANAGSTFSGWKGGGCSGNGACNITITTNTSVTARFDLTPDFSISASALSPGTVSPGGSATSNIEVTAVGGFNSSVALTCSVSPTPQLAPQCSIAPNSVTPGTPATLTVSTTAPTMAVLTPFARSGAFYALSLPLLGVTLIGIKFGSARTTNRKLLVILFAAQLTTGLVFQAACGGGGSGSANQGNSGTPAGTYTITITGTSGLQHSTAVSLKVQ